ncbi:hypothetical protein Anapl_04869 [Anas platyrhynchos]|uniref:Uncharacterized protein n=1 Tax=Anas platyrhynchos TaxID=8839 RepID=R0LYA9_ANAPL|nr:hypothetical protein Anapl_04869 [Anas platyrhynchos]
MSDFDGQVANYGKVHTGNTLNQGKEPGTYFWALPEEVLVQCWEIGYGQEGRIHLKMHCGSVNVYVCLHIEVQNLENLFLPHTLGENDLGIPLPTCTLRSEYEQFFGCSTGSYSEGI